MPRLQLHIAFLILNEVQH